MTVGEAVVWMTPLIAAGLGGAGVLTVALAWYYGRIIDPVLGLVGIFTAAAFVAVGAGVVYNRGRSSHGP